MVQFDDVNLFFELTTVAVVASEECKDAAPVLFPRDERILS